MKKKMIAYISEFMLLFLVCFVLRIAVSFVPNARVETNVRKSYDNIVERGNYAALAIKAVDNEISKKDKLDYWTENGYLSSVLAVDPQHRVRSAMENVQEYDSAETENGGATRLISRLEGRNDAEMIRAEYWFGALTILRPLMYFFTYEQCISIFQGMFWILLGITMINMYKRLGGWAALALVFSLANVNIVIIPMLFHTGLVFVITLLAVNFVIIKLKNSEDIVPIMIFVGVSTAYFDWLSTPIVGFAVPTIVAILCLSTNERHSNFMLVFKSGVAWAVSYLGMLLSKWMVASVILRRNILTEALERIVADSSNNIYTENVGFKYVCEVIQRNIRFTEVFAFLPENTHLTVLGILMLLIVALIVVFARRSKSRNILDALIWIFVTSLAPFVWFMAFKGHTYGHCWFTYRCLAGTTMGWVIIVMIIMKMLIGGKGIDDAGAIFPKVERQ